MDEINQALTSCDLLTGYLDPIIQKLIHNLPNLLSSMSTQHSEKKETSSYVQLLGEYVMKPNENISVFLHWPDTKYAPISQRKVQHFHYHDFYEINYLYRGGVKNILQDTTIQQGCNQILLMNPYAYHDPKISDPDTLLFNILIRKEFSAEILSGYSPGNSNLINLFLDNSLGMGPLNPYLLFDNTPQINFILQQMILEYYQGQQYSQQVLYAKLIELWSLFARQQTEKFAQNEHNIPEDVTKILSYLCTHYATTNLSETAKQFGYSSNYLSQYLQRYTGYCYSDLIYNLKMQNATSYLIHSNFSLEEISERLGYSDVNYFRKIFKKKFGISPRAYRNQHKSNA